MAYSVSTDRPRLGYVLPVYQRRSGEHLAHVPRLLAELGKSIDIEMIIWDCRDEPPAFDGVQTVHTLRSQNLFARLREMRSLVRERVASGWQRWFIRTAPLPGLAAIWGGAETYYWCAFEYRPPATMRDRFDRLLADQVHRRSSYIVTAAGLEDCLHTHFGLPYSKLLFLDNDIDTQAYCPLPSEERDAVRAEFGIPDGRVLLLYVHRLARWRGAHFLIPVLEHCAAAGLDVCLMAVGGSGSESEALAAYAQAHPDRLILPGHQPNETLPRLYGAADIFLMPSLSEGFPRVVIEAMACGAPMVSTAVGCVERIIPAEWHETVLVPPTSIDGFADKVKALVQDRALRTQLGSAMRTRAEDFSVQAIAEQYRRVLCAER